MPLTKAKRSKIVKEAKSGKDFGKKGKKFKDVEEKAEKFYRKKGKSATEAKKIAKKVAGDSFWKQREKASR